MARRRRSQTSTSYTTHTLKRDVLTIASAPVALLQRALSPVLSPVEQTASLLDDWRNWVPEPRSRRPQTKSGNFPVIKQTRKATPFGYTDHFAAPGAVVQCVRRHRRREVLHALRKAGRRGKKGPYRRNMWSGVHC